MQSSGPSYWQNVRFFLVAGVGLFADGYLNTTIGLVVPMLGYLYWPDQHGVIPSALSDVMKGSLSLGMIIGQILFGLLGDKTGRHKVYGKELIITMFGTLMVVLLPWRQLSQSGIFAWISVFRVVTGIGIGADYPISSSLAAETPRQMSRAKVVLTIFSCIGLGTFTAGVVYLVLLEAFAKHIEDSIHSLEWVWRLLLGLGLVPCAATVYARLTIKETKAYEHYVENDNLQERNETNIFAFTQFFSQWRNASVLFGTAAAWFFFDIAFYGIGLNQSVILAAIGYGKGATPYLTLRHTAIGNLIALSAGNLPGYIIGIFLPDLLGRINLQAGASLLAAIVYAIWAGVTNHTNTGSALAIFTISQLVLNAGPNVTTFLVPVEVFPTRVRASAHGISAASGKVGAVVTAFAFGTLADVIGIKGVLGILAGAMILTAAVSLLIPEPRGKTLEQIEQSFCGDYGVQESTRVTTITTTPKADI